MEADLILLGHGSRRGTATDEGLREATRRLQSLAPQLRVRMAAWEFTEPSLNEVVGGLAAEGSRRIVVVPYFLFDGKHIKEEIPEVLEQLETQHPHVELRYAATLGVDHRLVRIAAERAHQGLTGGYCAALPCDCFQRDDLGVVFVNRGSHAEYDPGDRLRALAQETALLLGGRAPVLPAQAEYLPPTIGDCIDTLVAQGKSEVIVLPYLFFTGKVTSVNVVPPLEAAKERHPGVTFHLAPTLGVDDRIIQIAWERAQEALEQPVHS